MRAAGALRGGGTAIKARPPAWRRRCTVQVTGDAAGFSGIQNGPDQGGIIVSKLDPKGQLIYSFFHPHGLAAAIALDAAGSVYVAGTANPGISGINQVFSTPGNGQALVFKLSADGTKKIWETALGGSVRADASAIAAGSSSRPCSATSRTR